MTDFRLSPVSAREAFAQHLMRQGYDPMLSFTKDALEAFDVARKSDLATCLALPVGTDPLEQWIDRNFSGHGRALRTLQEPPIDGEPFMPMEDAKQLLRAGIAIFSAGHVSPESPETETLINFVSGLRQHEIDLEVRDELLKVIMRRPGLAPTPDYWLAQAIERFGPMPEGNTEASRLIGAIHYAFVEGAKAASPDTSTGREIERCQDCGQELPIRYPCYEQGCAIKCRF